MSEMVKRVAAAIAAVEIPAETPVPLYEWLARAAIAAMREPTSEMNRVGCRAIPAAHGQAWIYAPDAYTAMIDAALAAAS